MGKPEQAAFALLVFASLAMAATPIEKFLNDSFEPDQEAMAARLDVAGEYYIVTADTVETYVVDGSSGKQLKDKTALQNALVQDARAKGQLAEKASIALGLDEEILAAKEISEKKCMQYLGVDMHPCSDRESCIVSCFSVPQCSAGPLYSDGFLEAFMEWNLGRQRFSSLIASYSSSQEKILEDTAAVDQKLAILYELASLSQNLSTNPIFLNRTDPGCQGGGTVRCYEYCPKIDYSPSRIETAKQSLAGVKTALNAVSLQAARAGAILNRSNQNDLYLSTRKVAYAEFRDDMADRISNITNRSNELSQRLLEPELQPKISWLAGVFAGMEEDAAAGLYRKAMASRPLVESAADNASRLIAKDEALLESLQSKYASIERKVHNSEWLIGNASAEIYLSELAGIKSNATAPLTLLALDSALQAANSLADRVDDDIAAAASERGGSASGGLVPQVPIPQGNGGGGLACPIALVLSSVIVAAFLRK